VRVPSQFLRQTVTVQDRTQTSDGPVWGPERTVRCRVDWGRTLVRTPTGDDITVAGAILVRPDVDIAVGSRVTIDGDKRTLFSVTPIYGPGSRLAGRKVLVQ
jgi:hypothetical protein